jgi:hypothetical protein
MVAASDTQWHRLARDGQCVITLHLTGNPLPLTARKRAGVVSAEPLQMYLLVHRSARACAALQECSGTDL